VRKLTDDQIHKMCDEPWLWNLALREEAKRRQLPVTSVTEINMVVTALRNSLRK